MPCYVPLHAWKRKTGEGVSFTPGRGAIPVQLACNQCIGCRIERARQWTTRIIHETASHGAAQFVTLTYRPENLPANGSLVKAHPSAFFKRLRSRLATKLRYYCCGEYGESLLRPHYHAIIWHTNAIPNATVEAAWGHGYTSTATFSQERAAYVARYSIKKLNGPRARSHYQRVDPRTGEVIQLTPEFALMSRRPGIGSSWFDQFESDLYPDDFVIHAGKKLRVPRYYDQKLDELELAEIKRQRRRNAHKFAANNTPERLKVRAIVAASKLNIGKRNLDAN